MTVIRPTVTDEMIERGREAREGHYLRVSPVGCTCGWKSDTYIEADGLPRFEAHLVELALEAAAPLIAAQALRDLAASMDSEEWGHQDDWGVNCAYAFEVRARADQIEAGR